MSRESELPWTGERLVPSFTGDAAIEHLHRYAFAMDFARDKDVLDIACGEGYGSHLLSSVAASVTGVDISSEVIEHAREKYGKQVVFEVGSCVAIPMQNASVDLVVSFETLEHIAEHDEMMTEVKRVLRPGGVLIISTPDKMNYTIIPNYKNPFHILELSTEEFGQLLARYFAHTRMFEQKICHGSVMAPADRDYQAGVRHYLGDFDRLQHADGIMTPLYNIAVSSDAEIPDVHAVTIFEGWGVPTDIEKQLDDIRSTDGAAAARLEKQREDIRRQLNESNASALAALTHLEEQRDEFRRQLEHANASSTAVVARLEEQRDAVQRQLEHSNASALAALTHLEEQRDEFRRQLEHTTASSTAVLARLEEQRDAVQRQLEESNASALAALTHVEEQRDEFRRQLEHANASSMAAVSRLEEQRDGVRRQLEDSNASALAALTHVEEQRDEFKRQLEHANASGAATASRLEEQREAIRQQLEGAHAAAAAAIANLEQQREAIRQQLVDGNRAAEAALSHLEGQRDHYKAQLSELATVHEVVSREAESLKRLLDEAPHRIAARISRLARRVSAALAGGPQKGS